MFFTHGVFPQQVVLSLSFTTVDSPQSAKQRPPSWQDLWGTHLHQFSNWCDHLQDGRVMPWVQANECKASQKFFLCFCRFDFTWSCTSSSQSSSCMMCSKGLKSASLKWKWGSSAQLVNTSVRTLWMKDTAFWDTCLSLWHEAWEKYVLVVMKSCRRWTKRLNPQLW